MNNLNATINNNNNNNNINNNICNINNNNIPLDEVDEDDCIDDAISSSGEQPDPDYIKMFVGQVPKSMDEDQLKEMFEEYGRVHSINVLRDKVNGISKGKIFFIFLLKLDTAKAYFPRFEEISLIGFKNFLYFSLSYFYFFFVIRNVKKKLNVHNSRRIINLCGWRHKYNKEGIVFLNDC